MDDHHEITLISPHYMDQLLQNAPKNVSHQFSSAVRITISQNDYA